MITDVNSEDRLAQETSVAKTNISGKWRITETDLWDQKAIDEEIVAGSGPSEKPSFLERAKARWGVRQPGDG